MKLTVLVENTTVSDKIKAEHGLSLYLETQQHRILFDMGAGSLYAANAEQMNIDLKTVDIAVLSHGHYDHGGGLNDFLQKNASANVYVSPFAFWPHYSRQSNGDYKEIGIDRELAYHPQFVMVGSKKEIDEELVVFSGVGGEYPRPASNCKLFMKWDENYIPDCFSHEQNLIIKDGSIYLVSGCAHCGIVNIVELCRELLGCYPHYVLSGFHQSDSSGRLQQTPEEIEQLGRRLLETGAMFYTGHCTGVEAYRILKTVMGDKVEYMAAGSNFTLN